MKRLVVLALCLLLLCGCRAEEQRSVREQNLAIAERAAEEYEAGADYWDAVEPNYQPLDENCVYWVPKGKSYHSTKDCVALLRSKTILHGTLKEAFAAGKNDPCSKCVGDP